MSLTECTFIRRDDIIDVKLREDVKEQMNRFI